MSEQKSSVSIILSVYNEAENLMEFWQQLNSSITGLNYHFELIWVNDGSDDNSLPILEEIKDQYAKDNIQHIILDFSKNFGHEAAMIGGIDHAKGDIMICMDVDGQHPPERIKEMLSAANDGFQVVNMIRTARADQTINNGFLSKLFYKIINAISEEKFHENASDFFLISKVVADVLRVHYRENNRFLRGYIQSIGFTQTYLSYEAPHRLHGESKYSFRKLLHLSGMAIFSFSNKPLKMVLWVSLIFILFSLILGLYSLYMFFMSEEIPDGYTTQILFMSVSFSILFFLLGIQSIYFSKSIEEIRKRPIYVIKGKTKG